MILALAQLNHPSYSPALWQGTLVYWGVMVVAILINGYASKILPKLESFMLVLHILGFFAILVPLVSVSTGYVPMQSPVIEGR
jgi:choline transport protein